MKKQALFIRLDRMGDLVLTLPCDSLAQNDYEVTWIVPKGLEFVLEQSEPSRSFYALTKTFSWSEFFKFYKILRQLKPNVAISYHVPWWIPLALFFARIPIRGGVLSQWHSYLFLNKGLRQKRSRCEHHEMEYNYLLTEYVLDKPRKPSLWQPLKLAVKSETQLPIDTMSNYFVVHPGMGGSALNWPNSHYAQLIKELSTKATVIITGTQADEIYLKPLKESLKDNPRVVWLDKQLNGYQLLKLLKSAKANIAPSTGVLHLSASLGVPSLGIYSPIKVHQAKRWGPKGSQAFTFTPSVNCPAHFECLKQQCSQFDCMSSMPIHGILNKALSFL